MNDKDALYEVYRTDADLTHIKLFHQGFNRDVAETKMYQLFRAACFDIDFLMYNRETQENEVLCLTEQTKRKRNECQG